MNQSAWYVLSQFREDDDVLLWGTPIRSLEEAERRRAQDQEEAGKWGFDYRIVRLDYTITPEEDDAA